MKTKTPKLRIGTFYEVQSSKDWINVRRYETSVTCEDRNYIMMAECYKWVISNRGGRAIDVPEEVFFEY